MPLHLLYLGHKSMEPDLILRRTDWIREFGQQRLDDLGRGLPQPWLSSFCDRAGSEKDGCGLRLPGQCVGRGGGDHRDDDLEMCW